MTPAELLANKGRLVKFRDCSLILKAAKTIHEKSGEIKVKALLKDTQHRSSYIIARAEEVKPHEEAHGGLNVNRFSAVLHGLFCG